MTAAGVLAWPRENARMMSSLLPSVAKLFMAVGRMRAETLGASSFEESRTVDRLKFCSSQLMHPKKNAIPTISTLLEMTAPTRDVCTMRGWCDQRDDGNDQLDRVAEGD